MKEYMDLHMHSVKSDGDFTPKELVGKCVSLGLKAMAITDHDTIEGLAEAEKEADGKIIFIPGIEISCSEKDFPEVHVLGYFIDYNNQTIIDFLKKIKYERTNQKKKIIEKLNSLGFEISFDEVNSIVSGEVSRVHIAKIMVKKYPKEFKAVKDVFQNYIDCGKPAYAERTHVTTIKDAVDIIKKTGGIPVLAHPGMYGFDDASELIDLFSKSGGEGIEVYYPYEKIYVKYGLTEQDEKQKIEFFKNIAEKKDLIITGGSDFHGSTRKEVSINEMKVEYSKINR